MRRDGIGVSGVLVRVVGALLLVYGTWNPYGKSYWHWALAPLLNGGNSTGPAALKFLVGVLLASGWILFLAATKRSLGLVGALLAAALVGGTIWLLISWHVVSARSNIGITNVILIGLALCLGIGMSWSFVSRKLSGQLDTDVVG